MPPSPTDPPAAVPGDDLDGRVFLITGATGGIGRAAAETLVHRGGHVFLACRDGAAADAVVAALGAAGARGRAEVLRCDLGDLASVRAAAQAFLARGLPLHALVNNAGLAGARGLTKDGFELTFGVNHLGHFLLTRLLEPALAAGAPARIVNVASEAHRPEPALDFTALRRPTATVTGLREYGASKLCNILFTRQLARRLGGGVSAYALHPGVVATDIWRRVPPPFRQVMKLFMISPAEGARRVLHCATAPELAGVSGRYYVDYRETEPSAVATDDALGERLWVESERFVAAASG